MLTVDGIIFTLQRAGGISVIFRSLLDYLNQQGIVTTHLLDGQSLQELAQHSGSVKTEIRLARTLERYRSCRIADLGATGSLHRSPLYHSSYYRTPTDNKVTSVLSVYDFMYERYRKGPAKWVHTFQKNAAIKRAQSIICISQSTLDDLVEFVGVRSDQSVKVIHCGVSECFKPLKLDHQEFLHDPPTTGDRPFILFVGQRAGYKNFKLALTTLAELTDFELRCVGGGNFSPSEFEGVPEHVVSRVKHMGFTTDDELNLLYNQAVCLFYPSSYEGFGIPVIEAMRAGCPVVSTNCKAIVEIGADALQMVPEHDPSALARAVLRTASSDREAIVQRGIWNAQLYSWDITNQKTLQLYKELGL